MARRAAGPFYRRLSTRGRAQLEDRLKGMFLSTLARNLSRYRGQDVRVFTDRRSRRRGQVTVNAWLMEPRGYPTKLEFRFYRTPDGAWNVYDVSANGTSAVMYYRAYIQRMMRRYGPRWLGT
jgi:phospholipid transport system substrate-binding protein